jgi:hypothetical protein
MPELFPPLRRPKYKWEREIVMNLKDINLSWINLAQDRDQWQSLVKTIMNISSQEDLTSMRLLVNFVSIHVTYTYAC